MKNLIHASLIMVLLCLLFACNQTPKSNGDVGEVKPATIEVDATQMATMKDVICGMSMKNVPITDTAHVNGKVYPFCAKVCKEKFNENREKYTVN